MKSSYLKIYLTLAILFCQFSLVLAQPGNPNPPAAPFPLWALIALGGTAVGIKLLSKKQN